MNCLDHLLPFVDNGGRRSYIERRSNFKLARIPERRTGKERRVIYDRRKDQSSRQLNSFSVSNFNKKIVFIGRKSW